MTSKAWQPRKPLSELLSLSFNQDSSCFCVSVSDGFRIFNTNPYGPSVSAVGCDATKREERRAKISIVHFKEEEEERFGTNIPLKEDTMGNVVLFLLTKRCCVFSVIVDAIVCCWSFEGSVGHLRGISNGGRKNFRLG